MADNGGHEKPVLVSTERLAEHLGDENVVAAEVDENPALYEEGHIAGRGQAGPGLTDGNGRDALHGPSPLTWRVVGYRTPSYT